MSGASKIVVYNCARKAQTNEVEDDMGLGKSSSSCKGGSCNKTKSSQVYTRAAASQAPVAPTVQAPTTDVVTPAVARDIGMDTQTAQQNQALARSRLTGIRSTWSSFGGRSSKLGS